jgi:hypothetical protein
MLTGCNEIQCTVYSSASGAVRAASSRQPQGFVSSFTPLEVFVAELFFVRSCGTAEHLYAKRRQAQQL